MESFNVKETAKVLLSQPGCHGQALLPLSRVAQGLQHCRDGHLQLLWANLTVSHHPQSKDFLPNTEPKSSLFQFVSITPCPVTAVHNKESLSSFPVGPLQILQCSYEVSTLPSWVNSA